MAYTTAIDVFQAMNRVETASEDFTSVSGGDTLTLSNQFVVKDAYPNKSKTLILTVDGNVQDSADYSVDFETNELTYSGGDSGDAVVEYKHAPYSNNAVQNSISSVESYIDDFTNTTFDGLATVTDEVYDGRGNLQDTYVFNKRPVRDVTTVEVNKPENNTNPNYKALTEGLGEDFNQYQKLGVRFTDGGESPSRDPRDLRVTYDYGFSDVPEDLGRAATEMVVDDLVRGTVSGAMVDGRDNFDPQTVDVNVASYKEVLERYRIERMENMVTLAEEGTIT